MILDFDWDIRTLHYIRFFSLSVILVIVKLHDPAER